MTDIQLYWLGVTLGTVFGAWLAWGLMHMKLTRERREWNATVEQLKKQLEHASHAVRETGGFNF